MKQIFRIAACWCLIAIGGVALSAGARASAIDSTAAAEFNCKDSTCTYDKMVKPSKPDRLLTG